MCAQMPMTQIRNNEWLFHTSSTLYLIKKEISVILIDEDILNLSIHCDIPEDEVWSKLHHWSRRIFLGKLFFYCRKNWIAIREFIRRTILTIQRCLWKIPSKTYAFKCVQHLRLSQLQIFIVVISLPVNENITDKEVRKSTNALYLKKSLKSSTNSSFDRFLNSS